MIYDRKNKTIYNISQYGGNYLKFLYNTILGRGILKIIINPIFSKIYRKYNKMGISKYKIKKFIKDCNININEYEKKDYKSFNDFFIRKKININYDKNENAFISPADSKLTVYKIKSDLKIKVKQSIYTITELLDDEIDVEQFKNGNCLIFRLSVDDYHRYCYIDDGKLEKYKEIKGKLHTVSSISEKYKIYSQNSRICNYLNTKNFGKIIYIEVGALLVGKISNNYKESFLKGEEKGYFEPGGSTIVVLTGDNIIIDEDIIKQSKEGIETKVKYGERIGELKC